MALFFTGLGLSTVKGIENVSYEAGYVEWEMDMEQRLYVEGDDAESSVLQRARPDATVAFADVDPNTGLVNQSFIRCVVQSTCRPISAHISSHK